MVLKNQLSGFILLLKLLFIMIIMREEVFRLAAEVLPRMFSGSQNIVSSRSISKTITFKGTFQFSLRGKYHRSPSLQKEQNVTLEFIGLPVA